jgi:hypothetical protein
VRFRRFATQDGKAITVGVVGYWIDGKTIIAPDSENADAGYFRYPAGPATKLLRGFSDPIAAAVKPRASLTANPNRV